MRTLRHSPRLRALVAVLVAVAAVAVVALVVVVTGSRNTADVDEGVREIERSQASEQPDPEALVDPISDGPYLVAPGATKEQRRDAVAAGARYLLAQVQKRGQSVGLAGGDTLQDLLEFVGSQPRYLGIMLSVPPALLATEDPSPAAVRVATDITTSVLSADQDRLVVILDSLDQIATVRAALEPTVALGYAVDPSVSQFLKPGLVRKEGDRLEGLDMVLVNKADFPGQGAPRALISALDKAGVSVVAGGFGRSAEVLGDYTGAADATSTEARAFADADLDGFVALDPDAEKVVAQALRSRPGGR